MGLIHTRASKQRARAEAQLAEEQAALIRAERQRIAAEGGVPAERTSADSVLLQPTMRDAIAAFRRKRSR